MLTKMLHMLGGQAMRRADLRVLYAAVFLSWLGASITFPLRLLYAQAHHATPAELGLMAGAFLLAPLLAQLPMGWLVDRWGRVRVLIVGLCGHTLISLLFIFFNAPWELIALRFLEGIAVSAIQPSISAYIADVIPEEHRSEAYGVLNAMINGGMLIGPLVGGVVGQAYGFTTAFTINVAIEALAVLLVWARVHEPVVHRAHHEQTAALSWRRLATVPLLGAYTAFFSMQMVMGMLTALWSIWIHDIGGTYTYIGATFTVFALPQILLGAAAGRLTDRHGRAPLLLGAGLLIAIVYASYGFTTNLVAIMALGIAEGIFMIFQQPAAQGLLADASPPEARGRAQGAAGSIGAVGGAIAAFASLPLYHYARPLPFVAAGIVLALGSVVAASSALVLTRRRRAVAIEQSAGAAVR